MTTRDTPGNLADAALEYAKHGWAVFPLHGIRDGACTCGNPGCKHPGKHPRIGGAFHNATTDSEQIKNWWSRWPNANIGFAPASAGLVVIDVDGLDGDESAGGLGLFSEPTLTAETGRSDRGYHLFFQHPGGEIGNDADLGKGLDVRADHGYVVVAPSLHHSGKRYRFDPETRGCLAPLPPAVIDMLRSSGNGNGSAKPLPDKIVGGTRNDTLTSLAGSMRRRGCGEVEILAALESVNITRCQPALEQDELQSIARSIERYPPAAGGGAESPTDDPTLTDSGNSTRLIELHGARLRYIPTWASWLVWDGSHWAIDPRDVQVRELAKSVGEQLKHAAADETDTTQAKAKWRFALRSLDAQGIAGMVNLARGINGIPLEHEALDSDGWLLGVENGAVDLRTGELQPPDPHALITRQCTVEYDPDATAPRWEQALSEWFPDHEVRGYVQRLAGQAVVGGQSEHIFVIHYGPGGNGKGTFTRALQRVLGPYGVEVHLSLLVETRHREHDTVRADLFRSRLALAVETERRVRLAEASVKNLTGGDRIRARRMREDPWGFDPTHSLWLQTNHLPEISGRDMGIWRRIRVVEWVANFTDKAADRNLDDKLAAEAPGILAWMVRGCLAWQNEGLSEPEPVVRATLAYRQKEDVFTRFAADLGLEFSKGTKMQAGELQRLLTEWASEEGIDPPRQDLAEWLRDQGCRQRREYVTTEGQRKRARFWLGVSVGDGADH